MSEQEKQTRAVVQRLVNELADRGKIMEGGWRGYLMTSAPKGLNPEEEAQLRKAFYLGAQHLFSSILGFMDPGREPTERDVDRMNALDREMRDFVAELRAEEGQ